MSKSIDSKYDELLDGWHLFPEKGAHEEVAIEMKKHLSKKKHTTTSILDYWLEFTATNATVAFRKNRCSTNHKKRSTQPIETK